MLLIHSYILNKTKELLNLEGSSNTKFFYIMDSIYIQEDYEKMEEHEAKILVEDY